MTREQILEDWWRRYQLGQVSADHTAKQVFFEVLEPAAAALRKIAEGGMFSETNCIVAARDVLGYERPHSAGESRG